jgi:hypothetical protein
MTLFTSTGAPVDIALSAMGRPLQSFSSQHQGWHVHWKEIFGTLVMLALGGYFLYQVIDGIAYLGMSYYMQERLNDLFWGAIWIGLIIYRILHLKKVFSTRGEIFAKGFYLKYGASEYVYPFTDIAHLQKALIRGTHHNIHTVSLTLFLVSGEQITIHSNGDEVMVQFADALGGAYAQFKQHEVMEQFKRGEKI